MPGPQAQSPIRIGCAGWNLPKAVFPEFPAEGTHLERYAARFNAVEINSSFYKPHKPATYSRWAESTPADFRFSIKLPKEITHVRKLVGVGEPLAAFLHETSHLDRKLGPILIQQPPSAVYDGKIVATFLELLRGRFNGPIVWEPRHPSWFTGEAERLLADYKIARVAADPELAPGAAKPEAFDQVVYYRLHGSPRVYYSEYTPDQISDYARQLWRYAARGAEVWCIFDNTALGAATKNALELSRELSGSQAS